jgi:hypothetical protein
MKLLTKFIALTLLSISFSCNAQDKTSLDKSTVKKLIEHYFENNVKVIKNSNYPFEYYLTGDFNGDELTDILVVFHPKNIPNETKQIKIFKPWKPYWDDMFLKMQPKPLYTSLVIFNGTPDKNWFSDNTNIFVQLAFLGQLEPSAVRLRIMKKGTKAYKDNRYKLPPNATNDIIVIPSDAAIDTYFYWDKTNYKLLVTNEIP